MKASLVLGNLPAVFAVGDVRGGLTVPGFTEYDKQKDNELQQIRLQAVDSYK